MKRSSIVPLLILPLLAPTFYTNDTLKSIGCVWGVAVH